MAELRSYRTSQNVQRGAPLPPRVLEFLAGRGTNWTTDEINNEVWPYLREDETPQPGTWHPDVYALRQALMNSRATGTPEEQAQRAEEAKQALLAARENTNIRDAVRSWFNTQPNVVRRTLGLDY